MRMLPPVERWLCKLAGALKEQRQLADLTIFELAHRTGIPSTTLARYEIGGVWPPLHVLVRIADALKITMQELMP